MIKSKAFEILSKFTKEEFKEFHKFLRSPFHNKKIILLSELYLFIKKYHPHFDDKSLTKEVLFEYLFPGKTFNDSKLRILFSDLHRLAEEFLSYKNFKISNSSFNFGFNILHELSNRGLDNLFELKLKEIEHDVEKNQKIHNENYYNNLFVLKNLENEYYQFRDRSKAVRVFRPMAENFSYFALLQFMQIYLLIVYEKKISNYDISFINENVEDLLKNIFLLIESEEAYFELKVPYIPVYYNLIKLILTNEKIHFSKLKSFLIKNNMIDNLLKTSIYIYLNHYFNSNYKDPLKCDHLRKQKFDLDKLIFKSAKLPFGWPSLPDIPYLNVVRNSLRLKKFKWTKKFLDKSAVHFRRRNIQIFNLSNALFLFSNCKFKEAEEIVNKLEFKNNCNIEQANRMLKIMLCYELERIEEAINLIKSDLRWLYRKNNINIFWANNYKINLKHFERLAEFKDKAGTIKSDNCINKFLEFKKDVMAMNYFYEKDWIIKKAEELEKYFQFKS